MDEQILISVYLDTGYVVEWKLDGFAKAREFAAEMIARGCRTTEGEYTVWWPPHRIRKIKIKGGHETSHYPNKVRAT